MLTSLKQHSEAHPARATGDVERLATKHTHEVLAFLAERPLHTVIMAGWIRDHGLVSPLHRGTFYGYRNGAGQLEGVALVGHATMFEARTDAALAALARFAQRCPNAHMLLAPSEQVQSFWQHYCTGGQPLRLVCRELVFVQRRPAVVAAEPVPELRPATLADLELIVPVHAQMAYEESGVNPLDRDADGFRRRCARRIEQGRTWVLIEHDRLIFKADVIAETPELVYLEGVWVCPAARGRGQGLRCLSQLTRTLLDHAPAVSLLVNEQNVQAHAFYQRAGFALHGHFDTIFLQRHN